VIFAKRGMVKPLSGIYLVLVVLALALTSSFASASTGRECNETSESIRSDYCGGVSIYTPGYGAVELCQVCHQCGLSDGVCPEDYSDGRNETNFEERVLNMRTRRDVFFGDAYAVAFQTGNIACSNISSTCVYIQNSSDEVNWENFPLGGCSYNVSTVLIANNQYFRAVCEGVHMAPRCEYCPDPDCGTILSGMAYRLIDGVALSDVNIFINSSNNTRLTLSVNGSTNYNGLYTMPAITGYVNVNCQKAGYFTYSTLKYLKQGKNIVDCKMQEIGLACTPDCYYIDGAGNRICSAACDGKNGCVMSELAKDTCDGLPYLRSVFLNSTVILNETDNCSYENITSLTCCKETITNRISGIYAPGGCGGGSEPISPEDYLLYNEGNLSHMLVRNYKKELNGQTLTLSIRTYIK